MMRIGVLTSPGSWYFDDLRRAARGRWELVAYGFPQLCARLGRVPGPRIGVDTGDLAQCAGLLVRSMPPGSLEQVVFRMNALAQLESLGVAVLNPPRGLETAIDKYLTLARLRAADLRVPATITCQTQREAMDAFEQLGGDVVVKPLFGSEGRGITRISDTALAQRAFHLLEQLGAVIYLQEFIAHHGWDCRLLVIGSQVLAMRRHNPDDWRTNVSRGATTEPWRADADAQCLARRAADAVGTPLAGVDLLPGRDGMLYVLEVNAVPGWRALARTLRCDVARLVLEHLDATITTAPTRAAPHAAAEPIVADDLNYE
jgi:RimK family alpha-L-glutamate ligase